MLARGAVVSSLLFGEGAVVVDKRGRERESERERERRGPHLRVAFI